MKLSNIFKKSTKTVVKANIEKIDSKQLEKVIGGASVQWEPHKMPGLDLPEQQKNNN